MMMPYLQPTPALQQQIVAGIRAGAYPHLAAEARGVARQEFQRWLKLGHGEGAIEPYAEFHAEVRSARAQARLRAEMAVLEKHPKIWLEHGPGRETNSVPGWTASVRAPVVIRGQRHNPLLDAAFMNICVSLLDAVQPYPEAHACITSLMETWKGDLP